MKKHVHICGGLSSQLHGYACVIRQRNMGHDVTYSECPIKPFWKPGERSDRKHETWQLGELGVVLTQVPDDFEKRQIIPGPGRARGSYVRGDATESMNLLYNHIDFTPVIDKSMINQVQQYDCGVMIRRGDFISEGIDTSEYPGYLTQAQNTHDRIIASSDDYTWVKHNTPDNIHCLKEPKQAHPASVIYAMAHAHHLFGNGRSGFFLFAKALSKII